MDKVYLDENIFYVDDFMSKEDLEYFLNSIGNENEVDYEMAGTPSQISILFKHDSKSSEIWKNIYCDKIVSLIDNDDEFFDVKNPFALIKYKTEAIYSDEEQKEAHDWLMWPHKDDYESCTDCLKKGFTECENECKKAQVKIAKGFVIYLTENFEGGETVYTNKNITVKPKSGRIIVHPGNEEYLHGVKNFYGGERIIYSGFIHKKI